MTMQLRVPKVSARWLWWSAAIAVLVGAVIFKDRWLPAARGLLASPSTAESPRDENGHAEAEHDHEHGHAGHDEGNALELSEQARRNIGVQVAPLALMDFTSTITVPGMIAELPGRSTIEVTAALTGIITSIHVLEGQAIEPGQHLLDIRLTHEEVVQAQGDLLRAAEELDVIRQEVSRLEKVTSSGAIAGKTLLERKYEQQKQEASLRALRQALVLHGLSTQQVDSILQYRNLLPAFAVVAPGAGAQQSAADRRPVYQLQELKVGAGQYVNAGDSLAVLANPGQLYIEGTAFERDLRKIQSALDQAWPVSALMNTGGAAPEVVDGLRILFMAGKVDVESRAFHFYVLLPNEITRDTTNSEGRRFVSWRFRPGQRVDLQIPVERLHDRIVVPITAIADDGAETFVFQANGGLFVRRPVHVELRDRYNAVLANDGSVYPGDMIAMSGAHQMQIALKNKAGGGIDPHAGHNH